MKEKLSKKNQSVEKVFGIIETMSENKGPVRLQDISARVGLPASTTLRLLNTLMCYGYVNQDAETSKYSLSMKFCKIGEAVKAQFSIRDTVKPYLAELSEKCQESACLAIEEDMQVVYIDVVEGPDKMLRTLQRIGKSAPMHSTGVGKLMLLNYSGQQLEEFIRRKGLEALTPHTVTTKELLVSELQRAAAEGIATDNEECEIGARCIAAPIRDYSGKVVAGISISGPTSRISMDKVEYIKKAVRETAEKISEQLGYTGTPHAAL